MSKMSMPSALMQAVSFVKAQNISADWSGRSDRSRCPAQAFLDLLHSVVLV